MSIFVGLDCGGSSSRVMAVDSEGVLLYQGQSGAANLVSTPEGRLRKNLAHATVGCPQPTHVCGCFAGLINDNIRTRGLGILAELFPGAQLRAEPDYTAALYAAPNSDICVISGTGSLVCSRSNGKIVKSGGRGYILGDEGSGYYFGRDALLLFLNHRDRATGSLVKAVQDLFGSLDEPEIVAAVYRAPSPATILAKLAKAVGQDAVDGQEYAVASVNHNLNALAGVVSEHIKKFHMQKDEISITLSGGIWKAGAIYRETFAHLLSERLPNKQFDIQRLVKPPLHGAVELAKEMKIGH